MEMREKERKSRMQLISPSSSMAVMNDLGRVVADLDAQSTEAGCTQTQGSKNLADL